MNETTDVSHGDGLSNTEAVLPPEPDYFSKRTKYDEKAVEEWIDGSQRYPEDCVITACGSMVEQSIHFRRSDISEDISRIQTLKQEYDNGNVNFCELMAKTIESLRSRYKGNVEKWANEYVYTEERRDRSATIADIRKDECVSCFHLNLIFSDLMHSIGIDTKIIESFWIETKRQNVIGGYKNLERYKVDDGASFLEGEKKEAHFFTVVKKDEKYWLADAALWIKDSEGNPVAPVVHEVSKEDLLNRDIKIHLPNGNNRHYIIPRNSNTIEIE